MANEQAAQPVAVSGPGGNAAGARAGEDTTPPLAQPLHKADSGAPVSQLTPEAERGVEGARDVLLSFARDIERGDFGPAWAMLDAADRQKWSKPAFAALFADIPRRTVAIADGTIERAAGSSFYSAPIAITGSDGAGRAVRIEGEAVLRRVNDVDGATPAQLRWHFETLALNWVH